MVAAAAAVLLRRESAIEGGDGSGEAGFAGMRAGGDL